MAYNKDNASTGLRGTTTNPQYGRDTRKHDSVLSLDIF